VHSPEGDSQTVQSFSFMSSEDSSSSDANALVMAALAAQDDDEDNDGIEDDLLLESLPSKRDLLASSPYDDNG
jgi:hypothetical protein